MGGGQATNEQAKDAKSLTRFMLPTLLSVLVFSCNPHGPSPTNQANAPASCFMRAEDVAIGTPAGVTPASRAAALTTQPGGSCGESMRFYEYLPLSSGEVLEWKAMSDCLKMLIYIFFHNITHAYLICIHIHA